MTERVTAGVTGNPIPLIFDLGRMNALADQSPGTNILAVEICPRSRGLAYSIPCSKIDPPVPCREPAKPAIPLKCIDVQRQSGGCDWPFYNCICHSSQL